MVLYLKVVPKSKSDSIAGVVDDGAGRSRFVVRIKAPPVDGKANAAVLACLAKHLGCPRSSLTIIAGERTRQKSIRWDAPSDTATRLLTEILDRLPKEEG